MKFVEVNYTTDAHVGSDIVTYRLDFPQDVMGFNIKSVKVRSEENIAFTVDIMEEDNVDVIYQSTEEIKYHYDNIDIVHFPSVKAFFVRIHNRGSLATKFNIQIRGIEVK